MQTTDQNPGQTAPRPSFAWCSWHEGYSRSARLVRIIEAGSGPGGGLFACVSCRHAYDLTPVAEQQ